MPEISASAIPLIIGVAGHRDILPEAREKLEKEVRGILRQFREDYPATPLVILSALAFGADRLVVRVAIEMEIGFFVPLPWAWEDRPDPVPHGGGEAGLREMEELLAKARRVIVMPPTAQTAEERWELVGTYVARHSQILIALWDGDKHHDTGTCRVIGWHRDGRASPFSAGPGLLDRPERGPVYHVVTPHRASRLGPDEVRTHPPDFGGPAGHAFNAEKYFRSIWTSFNRYNVLASKASPGALEASKCQLLPAGAHDLLTRPQHKLLTFYARADLAARDQQACTRRVLIGLFLIAFGAFVVIEIYAHLCARLPLLAFYLASVTGAVSLYWWSRRCFHQEGYLDYRALSEALRVALFWDCAGIKESVADHYLRQFRSELDWIRHAARNCVLVSGAHCAVSSPDTLAEARLTIVKEHWIADQKSYFEGRANRRHRIHECLELTRAVLFWIGIVFASLVLAEHYFCQHVNHYLLVGVFGAAVLAAMLTEWNEKNGYGIDARRYQAAYVLYETACRRLGELDQTSDISQLITELGIEALSENADWVIQHRHRPIGMPNI